MSARFLGVPASRARKLLVLGLGPVIAWAGSCAVFPDHAQLAGAGAGVAGAGGEGVGAVGAGAGAGDGGSVAEGGAPEQPGGSAGAGGVGPEPSAGAAGQTGCASVEDTLEPTADTWIESATPGTGHGTDASLSVVNAADERRALLSFDIPAALAGVLVVRSTLELRLEANADPALAERHLQVHRLEQVVDETRTTWTNYANGGNRRWTTPGGDFGPVWATAVVPAQTNDGVVAFDITDALAQELSSELVSLSLIVLETGPEPPAPAELAFTSREGDAVGAPALVIEYCP